MAGSIEYIVSYEKALGDIIPYMREHDRKKAIPRSLVARSNTNALHGTGVHGHSHATPLKLNTRRGLRLEEFSYRWGTDKPAQRVRVSLGPKLRHQIYTRAEAPGHLGMTDKPAQSP